ncbi:IS30 family transposase [Lactiplantibacillus plantarum]|uniref:IS30 family transposase n=1 Tax=Lactiplantibacillus plantarum TaxID=1590 RepID=UPI0021A47742|nr:IS30 family transposase [Lactiplantibacillus plantarum]
MGVYRTTIDSKLKRVSEDLVYDATHAHKDAVSKKSACGRTSKWSDQLAYQIKRDLEDTWSPEQIAAVRGTVAFKTIYNWIESGLLSLSDKCLRHKGHRRKKQTETRSKMIVRHTIYQRSELINQHQTFGHWELDTIVCAVAFLVIAVIFNGVLGTLIHFSGAAKQGLPLNSVFVAPLIGSLILALLTFLSGVTGVGTEKGYLDTLSHNEE